MMSPPKTFVGAGDDFVDSVAARSSATSEDHRSVHKPNV